MQRQRSRPGDSAPGGFDRAPQRSFTRAFGIVAAPVNSGRRHLPDRLPPIDTATRRIFDVAAKIRRDLDTGSACNETTVRPNGLHDSIRCDEFIGTARMSFVGYARHALIPTGHSVAIPNALSSACTSITRFNTVSLRAFRGTIRSDATLSTRRCRAQADDATISS